MAVDFEAIWTLLKVPVDAQDFVYRAAADWGSFEDGFPAAMEDRSYNIKPSTNIDSRWEDIDNWVMVVDVEFILESAKDRYLASLSKAVQAIVDMGSVKGGNLCDVVNDGALRNMNALFLPRDKGLGKVLIQFNNIRLEIEG